MSALSISRVSIPQNFPEDFNYLLFPKKEPLLHMNFTRASANNSTQPSSSPSTPLHTNSALTSPTNSTTNNPTNNPNNNPYAASASSTTIISSSAATAGGGMMMMTARKILFSPHGWESFLVGGYGINDLRLYSKSRKSSSSGFYYEQVGCPLSNLDIIPLTVKTFDWCRHQSIPDLIGLGLTNGKSILLRMGYDPSSSSIDEKR